jgi:hypothetical protein
MVVAASGCAAAACCRSKTSRCSTCPPGIASRCSAPAFQTTSTSPPARWSLSARSGCPLGVFPGLGRLLARAFAVQRVLERLLRLVGQELLSTVPRLAWPNHPLWGMPIACWRLHPGTDGQRDGLGRGRRYLQAGAGSPPSPPRSQDGGARNAVDRERLGGERYGQEEQAASHAGSGVSLGGLRGGRSRPAGEAEAQGLRGGDAPAARRAGGHAGVGQGVGRQALHRVRGSGHRRQGGGRSSGSPSG